MKKGNRKILLGLLGVFLLLVGMYVYHVNSLKEGAWVVGGYTSRSGIPISRDKINEELNKLSEFVETAKAKYQNPGSSKHLDSRLFYNDTLNNLSTWADRLSMPTEIKAEIELLKTLGSNDALGSTGKNWGRDLKDIITKMQNVLEQRAARWSELPEAITRLMESVGGPGSTGGEITFDHLQAAFTGRLDRALAQLKIEGYPFDEVWEVMMDKYPLLDRDRDEPALKAQWEKNWERYPRRPPPQGEVGGTIGGTVSGDNWVKNKKPPPEDWRDGNINRGGGLPLPEVL